MSKKKYKMFCECCQKNVLVEDDENSTCPECGCDELCECDDPEIDAFDLFDNPCSPVDTVGGI